MKNLRKVKLKKISIRWIQQCTISILDANITTGLTALILFIFGTGPIKGFATTLLIGIGTSLFTAIFIIRILVDSRNDKGKDVSFSTKATKEFLSNINLSFLQKRKIAYIISALLITISLISLFSKGLNQGVDFVGGRSYTIRFEDPLIRLKLIQLLIMFLVVLR